MAVAGIRMGPVVVKDLVVRTVVGMGQRVAAEGRR